MPGFKKVLTVFGAREEVKANESLSAPGMSTLKRSNAVLKKGPNAGHVDDRTAARDASAFESAPSIIGVDGLHGERPEPRDDATLRMPAASVFEITGRRKSVLAIQPPSALRTANDLNKIPSMPTNKAAARTRKPHKILPQYVRLDAGPLEQGYQGPLRTIRETKAVRDHHYHSHRAPSLTSATSARNKLEDASRSIQHLSPPRQLSVRSRAHEKQAAQPCCPGGRFETLQEASSRELEAAIDGLVGQLKTLDDLEQQLASAKARRARASLPIPPRPRDCLVCGDSKPILEFPSTAPSATCTHSPQTCSDCLTAWLDSEVTSKGANDGPKCPQCPATLTHYEIQRAASPATFSTYDRLATRAALAALPDFAWCLNASCTSGQENPASYMRCVACDYAQCLTHRSAWHVGETCAQFTARAATQRKDEEEMKTAAMLDSVSKACPNPGGCGARIQKSDGCDHMTCKRCAWEFCWLCRASQTAIRREGNTAHAVTCRHHSRNLERLGVGGRR